MGHLQVSSCIDLKLTCRQKGTTVLRMEQWELSLWESAVADALSAERGVAKLNQVEAARRADIARTSYRLYEQGRRQPNAAQLAAIADAFGISFPYLMGEIKRRFDLARQAKDQS